jgi:hypothetical protein
MSSSFDPSMRCIVTPADRSFKRHQQEQAEILDEALTIGAVAKKGRVRLVARRKAK